MYGSGKREILVVGNEAIEKLFTGIYNWDPIVSNSYHFTFCPIEKYTASLYRSKEIGGVLDKGYNAILFDEVNLVTNLLTLPFIVSKLKELDIRYGFIVWALTPTHPTLPEGSNVLRLGVSDSEDIKEDLDKWFADEVRREVIECTEHTLLTA